MLKRNQILAKSKLVLLVLIFASVCVLHADQLPSPWVGQDVGAPAVAGDATYSQGRFSVEAAGADIGGVSDQFHFVYQQVAGAVEILARVDSLLQIDPWSSAGVMIRSSLAAGSAEGSTLLSAGNGLAFKRRTLTGSMTTSTSGENATAPRWVRLVRVGSLITAYSAADGATWTLIGSDTMALGTNVYVGLAITSHNPLAWTTGVLSNVSVIPLDIPSPQQQTDIGFPALAGSGTYRLGTYSVTGSGTEVAGTVDQLHFVYQPVAGDVDLVARVASLESVSSGSRAGVMIRESLSADSRDAFLWASAGQGLAFERRIDTGGFPQSTSVQTPPSLGSAQSFAVLAGSTVTNTGSSTITGDLGVSPGSAVTGFPPGVVVSGTIHANDAAAAAAKNSVTIAYNSLASQACTQDLSGQNLGGKTLTAGVYCFSSSAQLTGTLTLNAQGNANAVFIFKIGSTLTTASSSSVVLINGGSLGNVFWQVGSSATLGTTTSFAGNILALTSITVTTGASLRGRALARNGAVTLDTNTVTGGTGIAPTWVRLVRTAMRFEAFRSTDGQTWTSIGVDSLPMADTVYVGLAVTSDTSTQTATAAIDGFTLTLPPGNQPPTVALTGPANGATYTAPASVTLTATASDPQNQLTKVEFYQGTTLLGTAMTAPYSFTWASVPAGAYALKAMAYDAGGSSAMSAGVNISVTAPNQPPTVTLTAPANGATYTAPATITLAATASDPENRMVLVEFYQGTTLLVTATTAPYSFTWASVPAGTYALKAMAYDADGCSATSASVNITVTANQPPTVTLTAPANGAMYTAPASVTLTATASDPQNQLTRVEFYQGTTLLGTATTAPYSFTWASVPAGAYALKAMAYDAGGSSATSASVNITVMAANQPPTTFIFHASSDHDTSVTSYLFEIFPSGADPNTDSPVASSDIGRPTPDANGDIRRSFFSGLPPGTYVATVSAIGPGGQGRSAPVTFVR